MVSDDILPFGVFYLEKRALFYAILCIASDNSSTY
jgi:hypothetical protein